ncbi:glycoside hydrolase family 32 protein [Streptomyces sp. NPDC001893]|uniref:glycoside hydrolase family 32 protein n=1 Tax=Streptomyces sp. NPDC001893 TaxID=3154530 RepID=UPI00331EBE19
MNDDHPDGAHDVPGAHEVRDAHEVHDVHAPRARVRPPANWANDPNGPFRRRGRHHLFYQHNPAAPVHTNMHWGHASSADLAHWEHHPIALTPTPGGPDEAGCWSGCVVDDAGTPTAVYTGIDRHHTGLGAICLAQADPDDPLLVRWRPLAAPVVVGPPPGLDVVMFRDPFVFRHGGRRWALVGAGHADGTPSVLLYDCDDLKAWRFAGVLLDGRDPSAARLLGTDATGWECPQLFRTDAGDWVLVLSLWGGDPHATAALTGRLEEMKEGGWKFRVVSGGRPDHGRDFYAPAVLYDPDDGRTLLWGWSWEARPQGEVDRAGWSGVLTAPREMGTHADGSLRVRPAPELELLRSEEQLVGDVSNSGTALPVSYDVEVTARTPVTVTLCRAASGRELTVTLDPVAGTATLDRSGWPRRDAAGRETDSTPLVLRVPPTEELAARILVDGSLLELFAADRAVATERVYLRPDDTTALTVSGTPARIRGWEVAPQNHARPQGS